MIQATQFSAMGGLVGDHEFGLIHSPVYKYMQRIETMKQSGQWRSLGTLLWLCGGYVIPVAVKSEILTFKVKFDLEGQGQSPSKTKGILT